MSLSDLASVDLNLLVVLDALLTENNVTRAARRIGISQSAMSHALGRLRRLLDDPLLVRVGNEMRPTPRAKSLRQPVAQALRRIEEVLVPEDFHPEKMERTFRLFASSAVQPWLVPALAHRLSVQAPQAQLEVHDDSKANMVPSLSNGEGDLAVSFADDLDLPASICREILFSDRHVCVVREDLAGVGAALDWEQFAALQHVVALPRGSEYPVTANVDRALERRGLTRCRRVTVTGVLLIPPILAGADYVALVSGRTAAFLCSMFPLRQVEPPFGRDRYEVSMLWDVRYGGDLGHQWLRDLLHQVAAVGSEAWVEADRPAPLTEPANAGFGGPRGEAH